MTYEYGEPWWNDIGRGTLKNSEKTLTGAILSITNPTWADQGANPVEY
jgi:hypothetical protein